jgi:5-methylthioadenosine/S-adenosylhomocysteine deaminase
MSRTTLIENARVWPAAGAPVIEDGRILIDGERIRRVGRFRARADVRLDAGGGLVMPGLVQSHVHLGQTLFRGEAEDAALLPWLRDFIWPLEAAHDEDSLRASALLACAEMIRGGVTAFLSFETVRGTDAVFDAVAGTGLRAVVSHALMDSSGGYPPLAVDLDDALAECDLILERWRGVDRLRLAVAPRFALSCTAANLREAAAYARDRRLLLHTHAAEQPDEVARVLADTGQGNIEYLHSLGLTGPDVALAHAVHAEPAEREILARTGTRVLHCPSTNLKLGSGIAPVPEYLAAGVTVGLGSDGAPCNNRLDLFEEMRLAGLVQKIRRGPAALPAASVVRMATEDGARILGWEKDLGTLEEGKLASLIVVSLDGAHVVPGDDPATAVVYACRADDVQLTMSAGRILYENGACTTIDEEAARAAAREAKRKVFRRAGFL